MTFRLLLAVLVLTGASCTGSGVNRGMATVQDLNNLAAALTGRTDLHGSVDAGLDAVRQRALEFEAAGKAAYDKAIEAGASIEEAQLEAEKASKIGWSAGLGLVGLFAAGALGYFRRNKTRIPTTINTVVATAHELGLIDDARRAKLTGLTEAVALTLKAGTLAGAPPAPGSTAPPPTT